MGTEKSHGLDIGPPWTPSSAGLPIATAALCAGEDTGAATWRDSQESGSSSAEPGAPDIQGRAELVAVSASPSILGKSFTEMSLGFHFKGSSGKDLLIV